MIYNLTYPWQSFEDVKFISGELLNHVSVNIHFGKIYDNVIYRNSHPRLETASTSVTGITSFATSAEILLGSEHNKVVAVSAFQKSITDINQTLAYESSAANITDSIKICYGSFAATAGLSGPIVHKIDYTLPFTSELLNFRLHPESTNTAITSTLDSEFYCYKYDPSDNTDVATISLSVTDYLTTSFSLSHAYIVYYNLSGDIKNIKWTAIGI